MSLILLFIAKTIPFFAFFNLFILFFLSSSLYDKIILTKILEKRCDKMNELNKAANL